MGTYRPPPKAPPLDRRPPTLKRRAKEEGESLLESLSRLQKGVLRLRGEREGALALLRAEKAALGGARRSYEAAREAQQILQGIAQAVQQSAHKRISSVVSKCLKAVFGDSAYELRIVFEKKRGKTEARLTFVRDGKERHSPLDETSGGQVQVAAFALRVAAIVLGGELRRFVAADEPFSGVHKDLFPAVKAMLHSLADELEFQFIIVTQIEGLATGKVIEL